MKWVNALIDYDNAREVVEKNSADVAVNMALLIPAVASCLVSLIPNSEEVTCRLYGGWITLDRQTTPRGGWVLGEIANYRGRHGPLRTRLSMVTEVINCPDIPLIGTYRDGAQKMVDGMICTDLLTLAPDSDCSLVVVSDDDDFVPSLLSGASRRDRKNPIFLLRRQKKKGDAPNDGYLENVNVVIANY